ncbi:unnamed protein product [Vitrella brassicaformis CCMP3155]|uniref:Uncharacterized protein n=1 Tax=Vitrella brassicaformis (strain CCMP3155) TaxID=1169540 RepID=A0A0G4GMF3_VITBC|nr:unnamed protein product [Vitrella brassicaformis CCMP3155]|eukprot:CEM31308.1 unnamed protein product [Vitrella brassicaformis CCMP3155]
MPVTSHRFTQKSTQCWPGQVRDSLRPWKGLDMDKLVMSCPFFSDPYKPHEPMHTGCEHHGANLNYGGWLNSMTEDELTTYFDLSFWWQKYDWKIIMTAVFAYSRSMYWTGSWVFYTFGPTIVIAFVMQAREPNDGRLDADEYFENYWWIQYGQSYDHHRYMQWLEARRSRRWRGLIYENSLEIPNVNTDPHLSKVCPDFHKPKELTFILPEDLPEDLRPDPPVGS